MLLCSPCTTSPFCPHCPFPLSRLSLLSCPLLNPCHAPDTLLNSGLQRWELYIHCPHRRLLFMYVLIRYRLRGSDKTPKYSGFCRIRVWFFSCSKLGVSGSLCPTYRNAYFSIDLSFSRKFSLSLEFNITKERE